MLLILSYVLVDQCVVIKSPLLLEGRVLVMCLSKIDVLVM